MKINTENIFKLFLTSSLLISTYSVFAANDNYEIITQINEASDVHALDINNIFGENIDLFSGGLEFRQTDISIPGNNNIPVEFSRRYQTKGTGRKDQYTWSDGDGYITNGSWLGDWEPTIPRIRTVIRTEKGWREDRCSGPLTAIPAPIKVFNLYTQRWETKGYTRGWWNGTAIRNTRDGDQLLLEPNVGPSKTLGRVTKSNWKISCDKIASDGMEAFTAESPDGLKYTFSHVTLDSYSPYKPPRPYGTPIDLPIQNIPRQNASIWVTKIEDRFGNYVDYKYDINDRISRIESNDGRVITISYKTGSNLIEFVTADSLTWEYNYIEKPIQENNSSLNYIILEKVVLPNQTEWVFDLTSVHLDNWFGNDDYNFTDDTRARATGSITHPYGSVASYTVAKYRMPAKKLGTGLWRIFRYALWKKVISGTGFLPKTWTFQYEEADLFNNDPSETLKFTKVTTPNAIESIYYHYIMLDWAEGSLKKTEKRKENVLLSTVEYDYSKLFAAGRSNGEIGSNSDLSLNVKGVSEKRTIMNGNHYTTNYSAYNQYGMPEKKTEYNNFSQNIRYTKYEYYHDLNNWLLNQPESVKISDNDKDYKRVSETTYHSATIGNPAYAGLSLPYESKKFGAWITRNSEYFADGNVKKVESNVLMSNQNYRYVSFSNYKRGIPQTTTFPGRYIASNKMNSSKSVDYFGRTISMIDFNNNETNFGYDAAGRLKYVDRPAGWSDVYFSWFPLSNWGILRSSSVCQLNTTKTDCVSSTITMQSIETYDSLFRKMKIQLLDNNTGESKYQNYSYNYLNQPTFISHWSDTDSENNGVTNTYDGLGRLHSVKEYFGGEVTHTYLTNNRIKINDANNNDTTNTYLAYGEPEFILKTKTESPENVVTIQNFDILGNLRNITQTGPNGRGATLYETEERFYDENNNLCRINRQDVGNAGISVNSMGEKNWLEQGIGSGITCPAKGTSAVDYSYDNLGDLHTVDYPDTTPDVTHVYNNNGNLMSLSAGLTTQIYSYNSLNLLENETLSIDGRTFHLKYGFDENGSLKEITYPNGDKVTFAPNAFGQATQAKRIKGDFFYASNVNYYPNGMINSFKYGNGFNHKTILNSRNLPEKINDYSANTQAINYDYTYDYNSNVKSIIDNINSDYSLLNIDYDELDRWKNTTGNTNIVDSNATYDALGNILTYDTHNRRLYYIYESNRVKEITSDGVDAKFYDFSNGYDNRGNVTNNGHRSFSYNLANQMTSSGTNSYVYDGFNRRIKQTDRNGISYSMYSKKGILLYREVNVDPITKLGEGYNYIYLGKKLIAKDGFISFSSLTSQQHYRPFGETVETPKDDIGYTGHKFDTDLGLSYMQARYYDPVIGRFYSNDQVGFTGDIVSFNRYSYVGNNPYTYTDPTGLTRWKASVAYKVVGPVGLAFGYGVTFDDKTFEFSISGLIQTRIGAEAGGNLGFTTEPSSKKGNTASIKDKADISIGLGEETFKIEGENIGHPTDEKWEPKLEQAISIDKNGINLSPNIGISAGRGMEAEINISIHDIQKNINENIEKTKDAIDQLDQCIISGGCVNYR